MPNGRASGKVTPTPIDIPKPHIGSAAHAGPKTPADEGLEFFAREHQVGDAPIQVYELPLEEDGGPNKDRSYIRLPPPTKPYVLRLSLEAGTPPSKNGVLKTNFPLEGGSFGRDKYYERKLPTDLSKPIQLDLAISAPGAFHYWIEYDPPMFSAKTERIKGREGYFNVDPILKIHPRASILSDTLKPLSVAAGGGKLLPNKTVNLPLDGIAILTVVSKWMGPISQWRPHLAEAMERGYNMLHFTPLQQRGESRSPYSIEDQLAYDRELFDEPLSTHEGAVQMAGMLKIAREEYGLLSMTDVVLNHTSNSTKWLYDHPEAGYSPQNTPHLTPALELDDAIMRLSATLVSRSLPTKVTSQQDIATLVNALRDDMRALNFWQYYVLDSTTEKTKVKAALASGKVPQWTGDNLIGKTVVEIAQYVTTHGKVENLRAFSSRFCTHVDPTFAASLVKSAFSELKTPEELSEAWGRVVDVLNVPLYGEWEEDTRVALDNVSNRIRYMRLDDNGPKLGEISARMPLVETYFTRLPKNSRTAKHDPSALAVANNGWIWGADPLQNFALPPSKVYLRREVIVWGDCVKLRFGNAPKDNPWLWAYIKAYVKQLAGSFDGFRMDNCHSTPLHVGTYFLDAARKVNPNLYVCAELFTGSEEMDLVFVSHLGINSLIRESMNGWDPQEMSRLLYRHGVGKPIGSMDGACLTSKEELPNPLGHGAPRPCIVTPLQGSAPHALLFDVTHDNESPLHKRSAEDALSTGSLVPFAWCATGSNKGFDDLYPKLLDLVNESRKYEVLTGEEDRGISRMKRILNHLHVEMVLGEYNEGHVHQENEASYIVTHRVQHTTQKGYLLVAHTAFHKGSKERGWIKPVQLRRTKATFIAGATINVTGYEDISSKTTLLGLPSKLEDLPPCIPGQGSDAAGPYSEIRVPEYFPPGSVMLFETQMDGLRPELEEICKQGADEAFADLDLVELNVLLYRADGEERDATDGHGTYDIPALGTNVYCGLEGWMTHLRHIMQYNDLGHPLCAHLRNGTWAMDWTVNRLTKQQTTFPKLRVPVAWFNERFNEIKATSADFLRPKYFAIVIYEAYKAARRVVMDQCSDFVSSGHSFTQDLALVSVQMHGLVKSASLDPVKAVPSLAAGLPHFSANWARCWGRDVFISLRGLFLTTGNFTAAKRHILAFCSTLKHGLIPNLLDSIRNPRYNSRDSPWWMVQNIQDYVLSAPDGISILAESVPRRFPADDSWVAWNDPRAYAYHSTVAEVIQEILQRHANGIHFREHNAGPNLDMQMTDAGFNIDIYVDWKSGIIFGGNKHNCGTWMDKMGESYKAGNKGVPGTPRDGAPVEITGLLASALRWLDDLSSKGQFPFKGVQAEINGKRRLVTYKEWHSLLKESFEYNYYVPVDPKDDVKYNCQTSIVNRRGIYKDVYGSGPGREWSDYQFRPNYPIAMVVAPELFDPAHALGALRLVDEVLKGPLGMRTLDPIDQQYHGDYDNSNDGTDFAIAKGLNYHQGPEWMWPMGYFLRAYLYFDTSVGKGSEDANETLQYLLNSLLPARRHIVTAPWAGIPELTNRDGDYCRDACPTQAWSASTLLDFLEDVHHISQANL
ncbi:glycoside hydrolase family 13 protein [Dacryopinax primogenitus]|uniref:Glycogen debranching enzyme n=1 Tax=Dacryopinax primogenitus (strain DJM 731) TaxID=1858805 RepID=M5FZW2_DACPD|nr:glycoside hydrolase family 13 protein [Dacryopinax primogenitus]EJU03556.1 glycoside hydrolase family 13 protein [Dacryopinax primogenitus]